MLWLAAIALLAGLTVLFQAAQPGRGGVVKSISEAGGSLVVLERDRSGHYLAEGEINGRSVNFLIDTGATDVALSERLARELGLDFGPPVVVMTAAGSVRGWKTRLANVSIGAISLDNVGATITRGPLDEVLLGMSFLKHFTLHQRGTQLQIESGNMQDL